MILMKRFLMIAAMLAVVGGSVVFADSPNDLLPLGPSKYKLLIDKVEADQVKNSGTGKAVTLDEIVAQNPRADVFIIGEAHDNYECHTFQRDFIEALFKKHPKLIVGFEFFWREDNEALEQWRTGQISEEELIKKVGWYARGGQNYGYTRLIMDLIKKHKIKTIGLNVPRSILRNISRKGFAVLTAEEKALFPTHDIPNSEHRFFIKKVFGSMAVDMPAWFTNIYDAQKGWDVIMAESMRQTLAKKEFKGYKGIIIAGANHVHYHLGIPFRYKKADKRARIVTITPVLLPKEEKKDKKKDEDDDTGHPMMRSMMGKSKPSVLFARGIADYVFAARQPLNHHFPVFGFMLKEKDGTILVTRVTKESLAWKNGIRKDDRITAVDGTEVTTLEQLRLLISIKNYDDSVNFGVVKKVEIKKEE